MRYLAILIILLSLSACNLTSSTETAITATATTATTGSVIQTNSGNISFWQMIPITDTTATADDIVIIEQLVLRRVEQSSARTGFPVIDLESTIRAMLDSENVWNAENVSIEGIHVTEDKATIALNGTITAVGGAILSAVPLQFQLTVFEEPSINSFSMTVNGESIANLGAAHDSQAQAADYIFTREAFNASVATMR